MEHWSVEYWSGPDAVLGYSLLRSGTYATMLRPELTCPRCANIQFRTFFIRVSQSGDWREFFYRWMCLYQCTGGTYLRFGFGIAAAFIRKRHAIREHYHAFGGSPDT